MSETKFFCFGPLRLEQAGHDIEIGLNKAKALLVYLVVTGQAHSREALAALLWPELDSQRARGSLRRALHRLSKALGAGLFQIMDDTIRISPEAAIWLDVEVFQQTVRVCLDHDSDPTRHTLDILRSAVDLYHADFLAGFTLPDSPDFDDWQFFQREELRRSLARALIALATVSQQASEWEDAIHYTRRWLALDTLHEPAHRHLMQLYALDGQYTAALRQYDECVRILDQELGVPPEEETTKQFEQIRLRHLKPAVASASSTVLLGAAQDRLEGQVAHDLPVQTTPFIGRVHELEILATSLTDPSTRLVTIVGSGGIGKTRLALAGAENIRSAFADGIYFVPLAPLTTSEQIAPAIAERIGYRSAAGGESESQLINFLRDKQMMLVLDNFEHLMAGSEWVAQLLQSAPTIKVLVTSREQLHQSGETIFALDGLSYPGQMPPDDMLLEGNELAADLMAHDAVQLFVQRVRLVRPDLKLHVADYLPIARICRLVQGMPLALALAAGWAELLSFAEIAQEIERDLDFLESEARDLPGRQRSVRAAFVYSWQRLTEDEQKVFRLLSIFRGGFTRAAAHAVAGADLRALRTLSNKSFLMHVHDGRYAIHELLRQFGMEQLEITAEIDQVHDAYSKYYLGMLAASESDLKGSRAAEALLAIKADFDNVRAAWQWAASRRDLDGIDDALEALYLYLHFSSRFVDGASLMNLEHAPVPATALDGQSRTWGRVRARRSVLRSYIKPSYSVIQTELETNLAAAQTLGTEAELAFCLLAYGYYFSYSVGDFATALDYYKQSLHYYHQLGDRFYLVRTLHRIGYCYAHLNDLQSADRYTRQSLDLARETGNQVELAGILGNIASFAFALGNYADAERYSHEAAVVGSKVDDLARIEQGKMQLGLTCFFKGDIEQAGMLAQESLALARRIEFPAMKAYDLALLGLVASMKEEYTRGRVWCEASRQTPSTAFAGVLAHWGLAIACCGLREFESASHAMQEAFALALRHSYDAMLTWLLPVAALHYAHSGDPEQAVAYLGLAHSHPLSPAGWRSAWPLLTALHDDLAGLLGTEAFDSAWAGGQSLDLHEAVRQITKAIHHYQYDLVQVSLCSLALLCEPPKSLPVGGQRG